MCVSSRCVYLNDKKNMKFKINHIDISYFGVMNQVPKQDFFVSVSHFFRRVFWKQTEETSENKNEPNVFYEACVLIKY